MIESRWGGRLVVGALAALAFSCTGLHDDAADEPADAGSDGGSRSVARPGGEGGRSDGGPTAGTSGASGNGGTSGSGTSGGGADSGGAGNEGDPVDAGSDVAPSCTGDDCAACAAEPCLHGGACMPVSGGRKCTCAAPWFGESCENNDDAALSALAVTAGALWPAFDPEITEYTVDLGFADKRIAVIPSARVPQGASIRVEGENLESGATSAAKSLAINTSDGFSIVVSTNTDTRLTYSVTVRRSLVQRAYAKFNADKSSAYMEIGSSIAMDDEQIVYGLPGSKYIDIPNAGAVDTLLRQRGIFQHGQWIAPPTPQADARFGSQIALDDDYLAISAPDEDEGEFVDAGAVYVFERTDGGYQKVARLSEPGRLVSSRSFGRSLALAGDVLAVGGSQARVYPYRRISGQWVSQGFLDSATDSFFGTRVA
ncbi:MAG TPA: cadherin-like beta sandwich domain-containing protein, partial [Polyangiales bacterium]|nr:cadherin-like beta sandwich domain-containing protein [Polyangiales bacterium]